MSFSHPTRLPSNETVVLAGECYWLALRIDDVFGR